MPAAEDPVAPVEASPVAEVAKEDVAATEPEGVGQALGVRATFLLSHSSASQPSTEETAGTFLPEHC